MIKEKKKKIMIVAADRSQVPLYIAARDLGCETYAVSIDGDYPGFQYADNIVLRDIKDAEGVAKIAESLNIDAVVTASLDMALPAVGAACTHNDLRGLSMEAAMRSTNKYLMKEALQSHGVNTAIFAKVSNEEELLSASDKIGLPLIVKAVDLSASRGINIVRTEDELLDAYRSTMEASRLDYCIIEQFIEGYECSATAFVIDGETIFVLPTGDIRYGINEELPIGHYVPYEDNDVVMESIKQEVEKGVVALGLNNCAVNVDIIISDNKAYILEMTGRFGGNGMLDLSSIYYGIDMHRLIIKTALGDVDDIKATDFNGRYQPCICRMLFSEKKGIIRKLVYDDIDNNSDVDLTFYKQEGDSVEAFKGPKDYLGQVIVKAETLAECKKRLEDVLNNLQIDVQ